MVQYLGDFAEDETIYIAFNTFDSNDPSASVTITDLATTDIHIHKDGAIAQKTTDNGFTLSLNFDGITGNHMLAIDTSNDTGDAGFWVTGSDYHVRMEGTTIDTATVNAWIGHFSIQNRYSAGALRPTTAGRTLDVSAGGEAGIDWANIGSPTTAQNLSATNIDVDQVVASVSGAVGSVTGAVGSVTATVTADVDTIKTNPVVNGGTITFPTNATVASTTNITAGTITTATNLTTNNDKTGYSISGTKTTLDALNDVSTAQVNTEVDNSMVTYGLDHLLQTSIADTDVADNSFLAKLVDSTAVTADFTNFDWTTDSLRAIRDHIGDGTNLTEAGGDGDHLTAINLPNQTMDITGNLSGSVGSVTGAVGSVSGNVDGNVTGSVGSLTATAVDNIYDEAMTETTGAPAVTGTFRDAWKWMFALSRNKITQTATTTTLRNDADGADLATSTVSDDATTYTRGEWST